MDTLNKARPALSQVGLFDFFKNPSSTFFGRHWTLPFSSLETASCDQITSLSLFVGVAAVCTWLTYRSSSSSINPERISPHASGGLKLPPSDSISISLQNHSLFDGIPEIARDVSKIFKFKPSRNATEELVKKAAKGTAMRISNKLFKAEGTDVTCMPDIESSIVNLILQKLQENPISEEECKKQLLLIIEISIRDQLSHVDSKLFMDRLSKEIQNPTSTQAPAVQRKEAVDLWNRNLSLPFEEKSEEKVQFLEARFRPIDQNASVEETLLGNSLIRRLSDLHQDHLNGPHYRKTKERVNPVPSGGVFLDAVNNPQLTEDG